MDRGAPWATVHEVARVGQDLATKPPPPFWDLLSRVRIPGCSAQDTPKFWV